MAVMYFSRSTCASDLLCIGLLIGSLSGCGGGYSPPTRNCCLYIPSDEIADDLNITPDTAGKLLFATYRAYKLLVRQELHEHLPRQYLDGSYPRCKTGSNGVQFDDNDHSGLLSTGDEILVTFSQCIYDSVNGLGEVYMDGTLHFYHFAITDVQDHWTVDTNQQPIFYNDATTGPGGPFSTGFLYDAELERPANLPGTQVLRLLGDMFLNKYLDGVSPSMFIAHSGLSFEEMTTSAGDFSFIFNYGIQDYGAIQATHNQNGNIYGAYTYDRDNRYGPEYGGMNPPATTMHGRVSENDGYPSSGSFRITGSTTDITTGYRYNSTAVLTAQGADGQVLIEIHVADPSGTNYTSQYSAQTTWQALAASIN
jgi:hypothetical protein